MHAQFIRMISLPRRTRTLLSLVVLLVAFGTVAVPSVLAVNGNAIPTDTLTSSLNPSTYGQAVTFTATFYRDLRNPANRSKVAPQIVFFDGQTQIGAGNAVFGQESVTGSLTISTLSVGSHTIRAVGPGEVSMLQVVNAAAPREVPEGDTLFLLGGGMSGLGVWLRWQWGKRKQIR